MMANITTEGNKFVDPGRKNDYLRSIINVKGWDNFVWKLPSVDSHVGVILRLDKIEISS